MNNTVSTFYNLLLPYLLLTRKIPVTEHQLQSLCSRFGRLGDPDSVSYEDLFFFAQSAMPGLSSTRYGRTERILSNLLHVERCA